MNSHVIQTTGIHYHHSRAAKTLSDINLEVERGSIYGFIGPNGSGKTTTLSLILGLLPIQKGTICLFGQDFHKHRIEILKRTGALIETPSLYSHLTAEENLNVYRRLYDVPGKRIGETLKVVSLADTGRKKVKDFSLGMKQRLALALALLHEPELLILDEPTNGLDPSAIIEFRELLQHLNQTNGLTILVSSHMLTEIEKIATHIGIIFNGMMRFQGNAKQLHQIQDSHATLAIQTSNNQGALVLLKQFSPKLSAGLLTLSLDDPENVSKINRLLIDNSIEVYQLYQRKTDLEQLYLNFINQ